MENESEGMNQYFTNTIGDILSLGSMIKKADIVEGTHEEINVRVSVGLVDIELFKHANRMKFPGFDYHKAFDFVSSVMLGESNDMEPYISSYYWESFEQAGNLGKELREGFQKETSRQLSIVFPRYHCFQNIQFLFRGGYLHIISNMRSCNFEKNFMMDLYITYMLGLYMLTTSKKDCSNLQINVTMNIGSLHIYK